MSGNTTANGIFTITVTGPAAFTLKVLPGNAAWTGGGTVTANLDATVKVIVVAALATAAGVTADVVSPVLNKTGVLPLDAATIASLLAQSHGRPDALSGARHHRHAGGQGWSVVHRAEAELGRVRLCGRERGDIRMARSEHPAVDPGDREPYAAFEALLQALKLQQRQAARSPKLFDVLGQWLLPGGIPADVPTAIGGPTMLTIAGATNASPIVVTTTAPHRLVTGEQVTISLVQGNTATNGTFTITVTGPTTFTLNGSTGNGAWTTGGVVTLPAALSLSQALNASIEDVTKIATALGAGAPPLDPAHRAGTLADIAVLTRIANALDVVARYQISSATLLLLAAAAPGQESAEAAMGAYQARYQQSAWFAAVQPVEDGLRQARRDALVAYLLGPGPVTSPGAMFLATDDIFNYYLIDPEMCACGETTRLSQPSLAIQQFVQQCFLNLTINATVDMTDSRWKEWSWRQQYQLWRSNREVFLYPENFLLPETRSDASPFFTDLENDFGRPIATPMPPRRPSRTTCASSSACRASWWRLTTIRSSLTDRKCCTCSAARAPPRRNGSIAREPVRRRATAVGALGPRSISTLPRFTFCRSYGIAAFIWCGRSSRRKARDRRTRQCRSKVAKMCRRRGNSGPSSSQ